ncbi:MAG: NERD domain-containing protein [Anaerolineaceae bacterium]|nr:NERD domain-containing protein [Anaerolineaceae bacterium]
MAPARALARRARQLLQWAFVVFSIGILLVVVGTMAFVIQLLPPSHPSFGLYNLLRSVLFGVGVIFVVAGVGMAIRAFTRRTENDLAQMTGNFLQQQLDSQYSFIRNINRSGLGYIDAVLVGPPGVLVFHILNERGGLANEHSKWLRYVNGEWRTLRYNPTKEAVVDIDRLRVYLQRRQIQAEVFGVVVVVGNVSDVELHLVEPVVPVAHLTTLMDTLRSNYFKRTDRLPPQTVKTIRLLLLETTR